MGKNNILEEKTMTQNNNNLSTMSRVFAMPNKHTFTIKPIKKLIERYYNDKIWLNPFANQSKYGITNDLNPEFNTDYNEDYIIFMQRFKRCYGIFIDPPFSPRQISECYKRIGLKASQEDTQGFYSKAWNEILRIEPLYVIQCAWHSNGNEKYYEIIKDLRVKHGGQHYDTTVTVWKRKNILIEDAF